MGILSRHILGHRSNWIYFVLIVLFAMLLYLAHDEMPAYFAVGIIVSFTLLTSIFLYMLTKLRVQRKALEVQRDAIETQTNELVSLGEELFSMNEEKNRVLHALSHDLKNPINQVMGFANLLLSNMDEHTKDERKVFLSSIITASQRQLDMVGKLLDISSIEAKKTNITVHVLNLLDPLQKVIQSQKMFAEPKGIKINLEVKAQETTIQADLNYIYQVFENLLSNAIKFTFPRKQIFIEIVERNNTIMVSFIDEGPGVKREDIPKLFKTFSKLSNRPTAGENSTGLGLSLVKGYVNLMGGQVGYVDREDHHGAHFFVSFKKAESELAETAA
jgi:signal transduction histidine kinase